MNKVPGIFLIYQKIDIIINPMTETRKRAKVADFTHAVIEDGFGLLMKTSKRNGPDYLKVFMPLHYR